MAGGEPAGADGDVGALGDGLEEALGLRDGSGEVGVREHDDVPPGVQDAGADAVAFAAVAGILHEVNFGGGEGEVADQACGLVGGTVVDDDDFSGPVVGAHGCDDRLERGQDAGALVVSGDNDAVFGVLRHSRALSASPAVDVAIKVEDSS